MGNISTDPCCCIYTEICPEFYDAKEVVARKDHKCDECGETINKGQKYERVSGKWDGEVSTYKTCLPCLRIRKDLFTCGFHHGGLAEELWECYGVRL